MADEDQDNSEKTEEPTQKRINEAVKKGQVAFSREVSNFLILVALALNIIWFAPSYMKTTVFGLSNYIHSPHDFSVDLGNTLQITQEAILLFGAVMLLPIIATVFVAFFSSFIQNGFVISAESIIPKLEKISIMKGLKRLFSLRSLLEFFKGLIKISLVGIAAYIVVMSEIVRLENMAGYSIKSALDLLSSLAFKIVIAACMIMAVIAVMDFLYQRFEYYKSLRMTKQELKEEFKQSEGDPKIKARLRKIRMERAQKRMMAAVPDADVVIRNPEHFAVALKYDEATMSAPVVLALGQDIIALNIISVAEENNIIIVTNKPLAKALYESSEMDEEIPLEHYQAVAEVISYVYKVRGKAA